MEITIPGVLAGGSGPAIAAAGEQTGRAGRAIGDYLDKIQKNYDYNDATVITNGLELQLQDHAMQFTQKDSGEDANALKKYQEEQKKIIEDAVNKGGQINARVQDYVKTHAGTRAVDYTTRVNSALAENMIKRSIKVDQDAAQLSFDNAVNGGNVYENLKTAISDNAVKISAREAIYGGKVRDVLETVVNKGLINSLDNALKDPEKSRSIVAMMQDPKAKEEIMGYLTPEGKSHVLTLLKSMEGEVKLSDGMAIGVEIFKADKTGSLESMTDAVRARGLDSDTTRHAVTQIKELYSERRTDEIKRANDAKDKVNAILNPIARKRNGINRVSDLTPSQWSELERDNPEYAKQLQDSIRREADYEERQRKQDALLVKQERALVQAENEQRIMISDDFRTHDLKSELALGKITTLQYERLKKMQDSLDPIKRESVKAALSKVNTGGGLAAALGGLDKNEESLWKMKYGEVIKAFAENNIDDPNFDQKLTDFMEKHVFSEMTTSWFSTDATDRISRYNEALKTADPLRSEAISLLRTNKKPVTEGNIRHIVDQLKGRK